MKKSRRPSEPGGTQSMLTHWQAAVPNDRLAHLVKDVSRAFIRALQARLNAHGVPFGHWAFLRILWETDGLTQRELSDQAGVMEPTTFAAIKAMERLGYVVRVRRPENRRNIYIHLTPKGRLLKSRLVPLAEAVNGIGIRDIAPADVATTRQTLLAILENLARDEIESATTTRRIPATSKATRSKTTAPKTTTPQTTTSKMAMQKTATPTAAVARGATRRR